MMIHRLALLSVTTTLLSACATWWQPQADNRMVDPAYLAAMGPELPEGKMGEDLAQCYQTFADIESSRREAGVHYGGYYQVTGFPFIRIDRLMASYAGELDELDTIGLWLETMREYAHFSRSVELSELNMEPVARSRLLHQLSFCSVWLSLLTIDQEEASGRMMQAIRDSVPPPAAPAQAKSGNAEIIDAASLRAWRPVASDEAANEASTLKHFEACDRDALGRVGLVSDEWVRLAAIHAPTVLSPRPLTGPALGEDTWSVRNDGSPRLHYHPTFARLGDQTLLQFVYYIWLPHGDTADSGFDGTIWRVTLDHQGQPLIYDSIGLNGANHQWFAAQKMQAKSDIVVSRELVGAHSVALTLSASGRLLSVSRAHDIASPTGGEMTVVRYDDLAEMPLPEDKQRSMFDQHGRLRVAGPPVYMLGKHPALDSQGNTFDDPRLIERNFTIDEGRLIAEAPPQCGLQMKVAAFEAR